MSPKKKKKSSLKIWIFLIILIGIIGAIVVVGGRGKEAGLEVTFDEVSRGDITASVSATGNIQPTVIVSISSEVAGEIIELPVRDGDRVAKGDLLVRVNPDTLDAQVKQQEASLAARKASAAQARAQMLQAELDLRRLQDLFGKGVATQEQVDVALTTLEVRKSSHEAALHEISRQEMLLREASDQLAKASTFSPIDGQIVALEAELGDRVVGTGQFAGTTIMRVANLDEMEVQVDVPEGSIADIEIGDLAKVEIDAFPKTKFTGKVHEIANSAATANDITTFQVRITLDANEAALRPGMTATADIETQTVTDALKVPLGAVVVRPTREVNRILRERNNEGKPAETAEKPKESKSSGDPERPRGPRGGEGRGDRNSGDNRTSIVFVVKDSHAELRKVETGIADMDFIEIKNGLEPDETIVSGPYSALARELEDGSAIREREGGPFGGGWDR